MLNEFYDDINSFTYNGRNSLDMGLAVYEKENIYGRPKPVIEKVNIPGRGDVILNNKTDPIDNEEYEDFQKVYKCYVMPEEYQDLEMVARNVYAWLYQTVQYSRLDDSYERNYYRMAHVSEEMSVEEIAAALLGTLEIQFTCHPYKYSYDGERTLTLTKATSIFNTEGFTAYPYMKIYATGAVTLYINDRAHTFKEIEDYIEVDSALLNAYKGDTLQNNKMTTTLFPKLAAGENKIRWAGNVKKIDIVPRWCCL